MQRKILIVDDEPDIQEVVQFCLSSEGYEVITASNGQEAIKRVNADRPDLVLMDAMMPEMDGFEALKRLKDNLSTTNIPVIMLTARDRYADVAKGQQRGCDFYWTKPFKPADLTRLVKRVLES